jgi:uracil phosphoribosyltransferase
MKEIGMLMTYRITEEFELLDREIIPKEEPIELEFQEDYISIHGKPYFGQCLGNLKLGTKKPVIVPIIRNGLVLAEAISDVMGSARKGHIGIYRDPDTTDVFEYVVYLPEALNRKFIIVDPLIATGKTASRAIDIVKNHCGYYDRIYFISIILTNQAIDRIMSDHHGDYSVFYVEIDTLTSDNRVVPGVGVIADRLYGES